MTGGGSKLPLLETSVRTLRNGEVVIPEEQVDPSAKQPSRTRALRAFYEGTTVDRLTQAGQVALRNVPLRLPLAGGRRGTLGTHQGVLLVTEAEDADGVPNQVHSLRGNRMTVRKAGVSGLPLGVNNFQAVLLVGQAAGESAPFAREAEEFLRAAEPPEHDRWGQTEELTLRWSHSAHYRISRLTTEVNAAVKELVVRPKSAGSQENAKLRKKLTVQRKTSRVEGGVRIDTAGAGRAGRRDRCRRGVEDHRGGEAAARRRTAHDEPGGPAGRPVRQSTEARLGRTGRCGGMRGRGWSTSLHTACPSSRLSGLHRRHQPSGAQRVLAARSRTPCRCAGE